MARIRVECPDGLVHQTTVYAVDEDGTITPLDGVLSVTWRAAAGFTSAVIEFEQVEADIAGVVTE